MSLVDKLLELAAKRFQITDYALQADDDFFDKLGIDSIQAISLLTDIETLFNIEIPDYELKGVTTFRQLAKIVEARL